jgi:hypothetical protein
VCQQQIRNGLRGWNAISSIVAGIMPSSGKIDGDLPDFHTEPEHPDDRPESMNTAIVSSNSIPQRCR